MTHSEIVAALKQPAIINFTKVATEKKVLPSLFIANCIIKLSVFSDEDKEKLMKANNPLCIVAGKKYTKETIEIGSGESKTQYKVFATLDDMFNLNNDYTGEELSYEKALNAKKMSDAEKNQYLSIIEANKLAEIDKEAIDFLFTADGNNVVVETVDTKKEVEPTIVETEPVQNDTVLHLVKGAEILLSNTNLYETPLSSIPLRCISGKFYLNDGVNKNDRYAVTTKDHIGDPLFIIGYVKETEILR